ncbi:hypothetical protein KDL01_22050 [Actinospica durhamensis]|uniref:Uncharacterized protein n=1 Tax=Actinospica durhamensis TaxID=1508375 RepID=A0A941EVW5_9ACTN|nr:hypothetical protein [Actinospica durhamensis]MBR7835974.1 hypothetical protein [Actinospica durhamensis]
MYFFTYRAAHSGENRFPALWAALALGIAIGPAASAVFYVVARGLGAQVTRVAVGSGRMVRVWASPTRVVRLNTIPLSVRLNYLPRRERYGRDSRIVLATGVLTPALLGILEAVSLPAYAAPLCLCFALAYTSANALAVQPGTSRTAVARAFVTAPPEKDAMLAVPEYASLAHAVSATALGDLSASKDLLTGLRENPYTAGGSVLVEAAHQRIAGDYSASSRTLAGLLAPAPENQIPEDPVRGAAARTGALALSSLNAMLALERDPTLRDRAVPLAEKYLERYAKERGARAPQTLAMRTLLQLEKGELVTAAHMCRRQLSVAGTALDVAEALCTRARIEAARGDVRKAGATVARAGRIAPWYARVSVVHGRIITDVAAGVDLPASAPAVAAEAGLFDDPWSAPPS